MNNGEIGFIGPEDDGDDPFFRMDLRVYRSEAPLLFEILSQLRTPRSRAKKVKSLAEASLMRTSVIGSLEMSLRPPSGFGGGSTSSTQAPPAQNFQPTTNTQEPEGRPRNGRPLVPPSPARVNQIQNGLLAKVAGVPSSSRISGSPIVPFARKQSTQAPQEGEPSIGPERQSG